MSTVDAAHLPWPLQSSGHTSLTRVPGGRALSSCDRSCAQPPSSSRRTRQLIPKIAVPSACAGPPGPCAAPLDASLPHAAGQKPAPALPSVHTSSTPRPTNSSQIVAGANGAAAEAAALLHALGHISLPAEVLHSTASSPRSANSAQTGWSVSGGACAGSGQSSQLTGHRPDKIVPTGAMGFTVFRSVSQPIAMKAAQPPYAARMPFASSSHVAAAGWSLTADCACRLLPSSPTSPILGAGGTTAAAAPPAAATCGAETPQEASAHHVSSALLPAFIAPKAMAGRCAGCCGRDECLGAAVTTARDDHAPDRSLPAAGMTRACTRSGRMAWACGPGSVPLLYCRYAVEICQLHEPCAAAPTLVLPPTSATRQQARAAPRERGGAMAPQ
jgi:hypothetical protein